MSTRTANFTVLRDVLRKRYHIPMFQRPFAWEAPQIEFLLADLSASFGKTNCPSTGLGPLMTYRDTDGKINIFDGQQRMTTIFLLLMAMRSAFFQDDMVVGPVNSALLTNDTFSGQIKDTFHLIPKRKAIHDLMAWIYDNPEADKKDVQQQAINIYRVNNADIFTESANRRLNIGRTEIGRIAMCYSTCRIFVANKFSGDPIMAQDFLSHIFHRTQFLETDTFSIDDAMHQFERANNNASNLTAIDLLKNSIFASAKHEQHNEIDEVWEEILAMQERSKVSPDLMLRLAYISGMPNSQLKDATALYARNWFREADQLEFISKDPIGYSKSLLKLWKVAEQMDKHCDPAGNFCPPLKNYATLRKSTLDTLRPVVFAAMHLQPHIFHALMAAMESVTASAMLSKAEARAYSQMLVAWTPQINSIQTEQDFDYFLSTTVRDFLHRRRLPLRQNLEFMQQNKNNKYIHLILSKVSAYFECKFDPKANMEDVIESYSDLEIDHIMPKQGAISVDGGKIFRIGNLTLLEKPLNASAQDLPFEQKKDAFQRSRCRLTRQLVQDQGYGKNTAFRTASGTAPSFQSWGLSEIDARQRHYANLIIEAWSLDDVDTLLMNPHRQAA